MVGRRCISVFLCAFSYSGLQNPIDYKLPSDCYYGWKWKEIYPDLIDVTRFYCDDTDARCMCVYNLSSDWVYVVFRGTDSKQDLVVDFSVLKSEMRFLQDNGEGIDVHAGFRIQFNATIRFILNYLKKYPERKGVVCCGHSLGGALATICACYLKDEKHESNVKCINFGSPRTGNGRFAQEVNRLVEVERVVVGSDPVADIPTRLRWHHAGKKTLYSNYKRVKCVETDSWWNVIKIPNVMLLKDHGISKYVDSVSRDECEGNAPPKDAEQWTNEERLFIGLSIIMIYALFLILRKK
ncbi:class 3 lipase [Tetraselmis virus 1]|uniref:Class 3 lipase n=1 Tax=Tetraselmis virus 1 TaxID=2060617 RepID=A0A2P0VMM3_9VIRU|nr:class 3 lipase [Tetraselmis virus 1]AUF82148.1 class 3 lipase [Tetraselmis virus 1]